MLDLAGVSNRPAEESVVIDAVLPELFAALVGVHVESDCVLFSRLLVWPQLNVEPPPLERNLAGVDPMNTRLRLQK